MILAAGLTPAWQQILSFAAFRFGNVNRAESVDQCASGKVLNVGAAVHHLGHESHTLSPVGGHTGTQIQDDFARLQLPATWIDSQASTRICTTLLDRSTGKTTELVENSAALTSAELSQFMTAYFELAERAELVVLSGSLPAETPEDFYSGLIGPTRQRVVLDARGPELKACLPHRPWLVKPNREELAKTLGRSLTSRDDLVAAMRELLSAGAQRVLVSDGTGSLLAADGNGVEVFPTLSVPTVNPIGCGDCLSAGIAVAAVEGRSWPDCVVFGIATAAENAAHLLPARFTRAEVDARYAQFVAGAESRST